MGSNPQRQLPAYVPDLTAAFGLPNNDPLLPQNMGAGVENLRDAFSGSINSGSFSARHPIVSTLLGTLGGAALGGFAGSLDDDVGAARGAALGAFTGGVTTPILERQRKNRAAQTYMQLVPKIAEQQAQLEEMRQKRAGGLMAKQLGEAQGFDMSFLEANGRALPISDALVSENLDSIFGQNLFDATGQLQQGAGIQSGADIGRSIFGGSGVPLPGGQNPQTFNTLGNQNPQQSNLLPGQDPSGPQLELDPSVGRRQQPMQAGASRKQKPIPGERGVPRLRSEDVRKALELQNDQMKIGVQEAIDAPSTRALAEFRAAQTQETLQKLPLELQLILQQAELAKQRASLAGRTNPNIRGGANAGLTPEQQLELKQMGLFLGASDGKNPVPMSNPVMMRLADQLGISPGELETVVQESGGSPFQGIQNFLDSFKGQ